MNKIVKPLSQVKQKISCRPNADGYHTLLVSQQENAKITFTDFKPNSRKFSPAEHYF